MQRFSSAKTCASKDLWAKWIQSFNCRRCFSPIFQCSKCNYWHKSLAKWTNQWKMTTYLKTLCVVFVAVFDWFRACRQFTDDFLLKTLQIVRNVHSVTGSITSYVLLINSFSFVLATFPEKFPKIETISIYGSLSNPSDHAGDSL